MPETNRSEAHISLAYSTTKQVRHTSWQQGGWAEPRSLRMRYGAILDGLTQSKQRKDLLAKLAKGMAHPAV